MWGGGHLPMTDKKKDQEKDLGLLPACLHSGWQVSHPVTVAATALSWYQNPDSQIPFFRLPMWTED